MVEQGTTTNGIWMPTVQKMGFKIADQPGIGSVS